MSSSSWHRHELKQQKTKHKYALSKPKPTSPYQGILFCVGNPLLDVTVQLTGTSLLRKYDLDVNAAILAKEKHETLFDEIATMHNVTYTAGGAGQNALRIFQRMLDKPNASTYLGAVGSDKFGKLLVERSRADGLNAHFEIIKDSPTGICAVLQLGVNRSLIARLGAAKKMSQKFLQAEENQYLLNKARYFFIYGYFVDTNAAAALEIVKRAHENGCLIVMNMGAAFVVRKYIQELDELLPYVDIIIGNKDEALSYSVVRHLQCCKIREVGKCIECFPKENNEPRLVIVTDEEKPIHVFLRNHHLTFNVPKVCPSKIIDTNGCGDAFIGGFLSQYVQEKPLKFCVHAGIWAAQQIIQQVGCHLSKDLKFSPDLIHV